MAVTIEDNETAPTTASAKIFRIRALLATSRFAGEVAADGGLFKAGDASIKVKRGLCANTLN
jgi:hypothetical protein